MAGFTASWVHGNAVVSEGSANLVHCGWGTQIVMPPGQASWFHISIPTPVILDDKRMKLIRVFLQWQQIRGYPRSVSFADVHLWDGRTRVAKMSNNDFKQDSYATMLGHNTYELRQSREWYFGVGLSFRIGGLPMVNGHWVDTADAPVVVIGSAGADFEL